MKTTTRDWRSNFESISDVHCEAGCGVSMREAEADAVGLNADGLLACAACRAEEDAARAEDEAAEAEEGAIPAPADPGRTVRIPAQSMSELVYGGEAV